MKLDNWAIWIKGDDENGRTRRFRLNPDLIKAAPLHDLHDGEKIILGTEKTRGREAIRR